LALIYNSYATYIEFDFQPKKHPTLIFPLICFRRIWNFPMQFSDAFAFFKDDDVEDQIEILQ
jgi:hypothetical protein